VASFRTGDPLERLRFVADAVANKRVVAVARPAMTPACASRITSGFSSSPAEDEVSGAADGFIRDGA
jgi:hypothetical protein